MVTVFIPVYNGERYLKESLESVLRQTYNNLEILIVNDGSTDRSCEIIQHYQDERIRLVHNDGNKGLPYTRNRGLSEARGEYFATLDCDDIAFPKRIKLQVEFLERHRDIDVATTDYLAFSGYLAKPIRNRNTSDETKINLIFGSSFICNSTSMIRMSSIRKWGIRYNEKCFVAQDTELWAQISKVGKIANIPKVLGKYRTGHENVTRKTNRTRLKERTQITADICNDLLEYYGFALDQEEKTLFHLFFGRNPKKSTLIVDNIQALLALFEKLRIKGKENFDEYLFNTILENKVKNVVVNINASISHKIEQYKKLMPDATFDDIQTIFWRHLYHYTKSTIVDFAISK